MPGDERGRVLVLEDHEVMARVTRQVLERGGYAVTVETSADRAAEVAVAVRPQVAIVDVQMPPFARFHAIMQLAGLDAGVRPVIVAASGHNDPAMAEEARRQGADEFLPKPWRPDELLEMAERFTGA